MKDSLKSNICKQIKEIRAASGLSQMQFAKKYGIPAGTLKNWEQGIAVPPAYVLELLSRAVEADISQEAETTWAEKNDLVQEAETPWAEKNDLIQKDKKTSVYDFTTKFEEKIFDTINAFGMLKDTSDCVVGLSGGADSVCLLLVLNKYCGENGIKLHAVHINHMIRGEEALRDQEYSAQMCEKLGVDFHIYNEDVTAQARELSLTVEEAGRRIRYMRFEELAIKLGPNTKIAVAHHQNDVAETIILNLVRGTGMDGLKGIPAARDNIIRPLIEAQREDIERYLILKNVDYCIDSTNLSNDYTRNKIRNVVIPELNRINSRSVAHICQTGRKAAEYARYINTEVDKIYEKVVEGGNRIKLIEVLEMDSLICDILIRKLIGRICGGLKDIGENHVNEVKKLFAAQSGARISLPKGGIVRRNYEYIIFEREDPESTSKENAVEAVNNVEIEICGEGCYEIAFAHKKLVVKEIDEPKNLDLSKKQYTKYIDCATIKSTLSIRTCRPSDYLIYNDKGSKKKLNRVFIDGKVDREQREIIPLIADGDCVVWAVGVRFGENYKVSSSTKKVWELKIVD